jgi:hypothetical protein
MYYIYGISGPSLLIESTDSMIRTLVDTYTCTRTFEMELIANAWNLSYRIQRIVSLTQEREYLL